MESKILAEILNAERFHLLRKLQDPEVDDVYIQGGLEVIERIVEGIASCAGQAQEEPRLPPDAPERMPLGDYEI